MWACQEGTKTGLGERISQISLPSFQQSKATRFLEGTGFFLNLSCSANMADPHRAPSVCPAYVEARQATVLLGEEAKLELQRDCRFPSGRHHFRNGAPRRPHPTLSKRNGKLMLTPPDKLLIFGNKRTQMFKSPGMLQVQQNKSYSSFQNSLVKTMRWLAERG